MIRTISKIVLIGTILLLLCCLYGCTRSTPSSEHIAASATESLNAISATLTPECKTKAVESEIIAAQSAIKATIAACNSEKDVISQEKIRWKWSFFALAIIILVYVARKVIK